MNSSNKKINYATVFFLFTTLVLAVLLIVNLTKQQKQQGYDSSSIMSRISYIQELALVRYNYTGVIAFKDHKKFLNLNIPLTDKYFLIKYNGHIKAGVDFSRIKIDVQDETSVHVSIPKPRILDTVIDENTIQVFNESENAFNPLKISDYNDAIAREKTVMAQDAVKQGVYTQATDQAKLAITALLEQMGFTDIRITEELTVPSIH
ncbi:MAG TPA: hypothetical protein DDZ96_09140 [Porphyromonadaceae bacterium]|uniref:DUF4230 domain-containing protein n=1 Tax=Limibacterium fermenti TaxID=3229863 RepID=UPI000E98944C|nr:hypothetical protein [Porphyromonadaceae bacterium]HBL33960.1 hypothetical protein [Porphyromonadaceae bacterium]HBX18879.1 hypothetical protein [Porphyromonadaceae bacterium]HBX44386.1 hypothetical protein [Porphyromonadaceae bacterium]HCM21166.1 hypothetical protein [Porphyromonadaceae bacterium]